MKFLFEMLAAYNAWANERLYDAAARLPDAGYRADRGAFFGSIHGTLNHILVGDRIWMHVFTSEGVRPSRLDAILYDDFAALRLARRAEDARICAYVATLSEEALAGNSPLQATAQPRRHRAISGAAAGSFLQPPDPPSRSGALPVDGVDGRGALSRPGRLSTPDGD